MSGKRRGRPPKNKKEEGAVYMTVKDLEDTAIPKAADEEEKEEDENKPLEFNPLTLENLDEIFKPKEDIAPYHWLITHGFAPTYGYAIKSDYPDDWEFVFDAMTDRGYSLEVTIDLSYNGDKWSLQIDWDNNDDEQIPGLDEEIRIEDFDADTPWEALQNLSKRIDLKYLLAVDEPKKPATPQTDEEVVDDVD